MPSTPSGRRSRTFKNQILLTLSLFTVLLLFAATWTALHLARGVTVPIQALAEATREVGTGNFATQVQVTARDELGTLVRSFNQMTTQLAANRRQIEEFTGSLQQAVQEIDQRRTLIETVLENIPTGVLSLDADGKIVRVNRAARQIFGDRALEPDRRSTQLVGEETARDIEHLMRRSSRLGSASKELEFVVGGHVVHAAVTLSPLGPRRSNAGYVLVIDDLTELLRAQKAAAWQEVAQRVAHEIKNPLTPIQLSVERLLRYLEPRRQPVRSARTGHAGRRMHHAHRARSRHAEDAGLRILPVRALPRGPPGAGRSQQHRAAGARRVSGAPRRRDHPRRSCRRTCRSSRPTTNCCAR